MNTIFSVVRNTQESDSLPKDTSFRSVNGSDSLRHCTGQLVIQNDCG